MWHNSTRSPPASRLAVLVVNMGEDGNCGIGSTGAHNLGLFNAGGGNQRAFNGLDSPSSSSGNYNAGAFNGTANATNNSGAGRGSINGLTGPARFVGLTGNGITGLGSGDAYTTPGAGSFNTGELAAPGPLAHLLGRI